MTLALCRTVGEFRQACDQARRRGPLGLVPTMGALHEGHLALVHEARKRAKTVAVSIFVNPTQFGPAEDLESYPRDLEGDLQKCREVGVDVVFAPAPQEMYPVGERTRVRVTSLTEVLCGRARPVHFEGVTTIVSKLFAVAGPCVAVFGRKDYQQLKVIERMARDLLLPVEVVGHAIVREHDGLALSSRNAYLSADERRRALAIARGLAASTALFELGERVVAALAQPVVQSLASVQLEVDYISLAEPETLVVYEPHDSVGERALLAVAAIAGSTRLIDNVVLGEDPAPSVRPTE